MKVKELKEFLDTVPEDYEVVMWTLIELDEFDAKALGVPHLSGEKVLENEDHELYIKYTAQELRFQLIFPVNK